MYLDFACAPDGPLPAPADALDPLAPLDAAGAPFPAALAPACPVDAPAGPVDAPDALP